MIEPLTELLHTLAMDAGWPAEVIAVLKISVSEDGTMYVDYPEEYSEQIGDLEYGDINGLPNAVIRPFIARAGSVINPIVATAAVNDFLDVIEVL